MAIRRPRIKPVANIGSVKRKVKGIANHNTVENKDKTADVGTDVRSDVAKHNIPIKNEEVAIETNPSTMFERNKIIKEEQSLSEDKKTIPKISANVNLQPKNSHESIQKPRQRIRATPCFDVRRNSITPNSSSTNTLLQTTTCSTNNNAFVTQGDNIEKSSIKESSQSKLFVQSGNRTPNHSRNQRCSESSSGGFLSPTSVQNNPPNFSINQQHSVQHETYSSCTPPSREHIPPRYRKISSMEDTQKLSSARKEFQSKYSRKSPEKSALKLCDFIFYNPSSNPMIFETKKANLNDNENEVEIENENPEENKEKEAESETKEEDERAPVPQLKLGPNGEIMLDERSLVIETTAEKHAKSALAASKSAIYLDEYSGNNGFYSRQKRTKEWTSEETIKFYRCLHTIGTDFSMMLSLFPNRSRRDLKLKFKKEERNNILLINKALLQPNKFDIESLKNELRREEEIAEEKRKEESEIKLKLQKKFENRLLNKNDKTDETNNNDGSKSGCYSRTKNCLNHGDLAYKMEQGNINNKKRRKKTKIKNDLKEDINQNISENSAIKNENQNVIKENINEKSEDCSDFISNETVENVSISEVDQDDMLSINSTNEFGYDETTGIEITDIGDILTLEDTLPEFKNSTLAIVTKHDKNSPENITHGIYIICRSTGIMSQKPLDLPEETINCILKAMGKI